jgi:uracil-DNA glycosylase
MIFFVGDKPSNKNTDPRVAFVGTASYKRLLGWIADMRISTNDIVLLNKDDIKNYAWGSAYIETGGMHDGGSFHTDILPQDRFIALGQNARKHLESMDIECFYLPHPSGRNIKANPSKSLKDKLKACRKFIFS